MEVGQLKPLGSILHDGWEKIYDYYVPKDFEVLSGSGDVSVLLVGGGGGGGTGANGVGAQPRGAGGGGGGVIETTKSVSVGKYVISVAPHTAKESDGLNTVAFGEIAYGGKTPTNLTGGASGAPQSKSGGTGVLYGGGGGAGAGANGTNGADTHTGGNGGNGVPSSITGVSTYYGGGGGGGGTTAGGGSGGGVAGLGGGGRGNHAAGGSYGEDGLANTGGGGGGGYGIASTGSRGGSGIVVVRYLTGSIVAIGGTITTDGAYTVHTFVSGVPSILISNLNGDIDEEYILESKVVNGYNGSPSFYVRINEDDDADYGCQLLYGEDDLSGAQRPAAATAMYIIGTIALGDLGQSSLKLFAKSGFVRTIIEEKQYGTYGTLVRDIILSGWSWNNTADNIISILIEGNQPGSIGVGSQITLYRKARRS
jgi:hypothetical protein